LINASLRNPFNGIESEEPGRYFVYYRLIAPQNPFNGIERSLLARYTAALATVSTNPFNGIER